MHNKQKIDSKLNAKTLSGAATLITTLTIVTPLCGLLFQCGCDSPWSGLDAGCNFNKPEADHQCPWCASMITGLLSTGCAIIGAVLAAMALSLPLAIFRPVNEIALRILSGLAVFMLIAILTAGLAALWQNYPFGVGSLLR
ncbi:MAG: hypothetical protein PHG00_05780 [Methylococcales bacterium]|nr:hypothetical protein [Methylococcales bacterium]